MDWGSVGNAAIAGGVGGLLGGLIGALVSRLFAERHRAIVTTVFVVAFAVVAPRLIEPMLDRPVTAVDMERELQADTDLGPLVEAWKRADASSFSEAMEQLAAAVQSGTAHDAAVNEFRAIMLGAAAPRMAYLDDSQVVQTAVLARDEYAELSRTRPTICQPMFNGAPFGDITPYLSEAVLARELALLRTAFEADTAASLNVLSGDEMTAAIDRVIGLTRDRVGDDVTLLAPDASLAGREARYCQVVSEFFGVVATLPPEEAAAFMRGLRAIG
jgi:hypothetical protein